MEKQYPSVYVKDDMIVVLDGDGEERAIAERISIKSTRKAVETGEIYLDIEYLYRGEPGVIEMPRGDMNRSGILKYQKYGLGVNDMNKDQILKHLINEEAEAPMVSSHVSVGWDEVNDAYVFKHYKGYGLKSCYVGNLAIKPKGSYGKWLKMVEEQVLGIFP
jgi:putative DNA primase/helicase